MNASSSSPTRPSLAPVSICPDFRATRSRSAASGRCWRSQPSIAPPTCLHPMPPRSVTASRLSRPLRLCPPIPADARGSSLQRRTEFFSDVTKSLHSRSLILPAGAEGMPVQPINDYVVGGVRKFLDALNSSGGPPIERLSPRDARQVLIDAQNSVTV